MAGRWRRSPTDGSIGSQVDELLELPSLQRLAREKIAELEACSCPLSLCAEQLPYCLLVTAP